MKIRFSGAGGLVRLLAVTALLGCGLQPASAAQSPVGSPEMGVIEAAAKALGGRDKLLGLKSIRIEGHGQIAYQDGGSNASGSPTAAQKWINLNGVQRTIDLVNGRMRVEQRQVHDFVFAYARNMTGQVRAHQVSDGEFAWNIDAQGNAVRIGAPAARARRIEMYANPIVLVRKALEPGSQVKLSNLRREGDLQVLDVETPQGDKLSFAVNEQTGFPAWSRWVAPQENVGEWTLTQYFNGYQRWNDVFFPSSYNTLGDWRNVPVNKLYTDRSSINVEFADMAAPAQVRSAAVPVPQQAPVAEVVAKGIWLLTGPGGANSILFEFADHLTLFEVPSSDERTAAIIALAERTVPGKKVTEAIVSHNHFDHSGGVRGAVGAGLTLIGHPANGELFAETTARPAVMFPDAQGPNPKPLKFRAVQDHLKLKDSQMEVDIYTVVQNNHFSEGVFAYVPGEKLLVQADLFDLGWDIMWWGNAYMDNVNFRKLEVVKDVPVHGKVLPLAEVQKLIAQQVQNVRDLCAKADASGFAVPGCPSRVP